MAVLSKVQLAKKYDRLVSQNKKYKAEIERLEDELAIALADTGKPTKAVRALKLQVKELQAELDDKNDMVESCQRAAIMNHARAQELWLELETLRPTPGFQTPASPTKNSQ